MTAHQASLWTRERTTKGRLIFGICYAIEPSTAEMRRWLHDRETPRGVKCHIYQWLRYRRQHD